MFYDNFLDVLSDQLSASGKTRFEALSPKEWNLLLTVPIMNILVQHDTDLPHQDMRVFATGYLSIK